jgi:hypothetical protein
VFRNKQDDQGVVVRNKARLVAKGFSVVHWVSDRTLSASGHLSTDASSRLLDLTGL